MHLATLALFVVTAAAAVTVFDSVVVPVTANRPPTYVSNATAKPPAVWMDAVAVA